MNENLKLHLALDETFSNQVFGYDASGNQIIGSVYGGVSVVPSVQFGSCLDFDGTSGYISVDDFPIDRTAVTIATWFKPALFKSDQVFLDKWHEFGLRLNGSSLNYAIDPPWTWKAGITVQEDTWYHVALTSDGTTLTVYINGVAQSTATHSGTASTEDYSLIIGARMQTAISYFQGSMAHVKIFEAALTAQEIKEEMVDDLNQTANYGYRSTSPLSLRLYDQDDLSRLFINDDVSSDVSHDLHIVVRNESEQVYSIAAFDTVGIHHHFELRFRGHVLHETLKDTAALQARFDNDLWTIRYSENTDNATEPDAILFEYIGDDSLTLNSGGDISWLLTDMHADAVGGARSTSVALRYQNIYYAGNETLTAMDGFTRTLIEVVKHTGLKNIPLHVGIVGNNTLLNDGTTDNELSLRIVNTSKDQEISLWNSTGESCQWIVTFETGEDEWDITDDDNGQAIEIEPADDAMLEKWSVHKDTTSLTWTITPMEGNDTFSKHGNGGYAADFTIKSLKTNAPIGIAHMHVQYMNMPGYWDGEVIVPVQKGPLVEKQIGAENRVGIGTDAPQAKLQVVGDVLVNGSVQVDGDDLIVFDPENNRHSMSLSFKDRIPRICVGGETTDAENGLDIQTISDVSLMRLLHNGNVGIGTTEPSARLEVSGSTLLAGNAQITGSAQITGHAQITGNVGIGTASSATPLRIGAAEDRTPSENGLYVYNGRTTSTDDAIICIQVNGRASGNPYLSWDVRGTNGWCMGIDNSDDQKLKIVPGWQNISNGGTGVNAPVVTFLRNGHVGIGTNNPLAPLHVKGTASVNAYWDDYLNSYGVHDSYGVDNQQVSILAEGLIATDCFRVYHSGTISDLRVKNVESRSSTQDDLALLTQLQVTNYAYIDVVKQGKLFHKGLIAQEVEAVFPEAVNFSTGFIPDVYALSCQVVYDAALCEMKISLGKIHGLEKDDRVRLVGKHGTQEVSVIQIISDTEFVVSEYDVSDLYDNDQVFVYGKQVNDFRAIDYQKIAVLAVGSIQELYEQNKKQEQVLQYLQTELDLIKQQLK